VLVKINAFLMDEIVIRLNGQGNAWPVFLGQEHPFYNSNNAFELSNASFSIISRNNLTGGINNELLIDAGHGIVQFLIQNNNHLPNALILTHPHIDHCLSTVWVAQSYYKFKNTKLPVYASKMCWEQVLKSFPQLEKTVEFNELKPGVASEVSEFNNCKITFLPVFHGESALGAGMILFQAQDQNTKALFTGDLVCPLLRQKDIELLKNCKVVYTDTNNRFAYPKSNHWSLVKNPDGINNNVLFDEWFNKKGKNLAWLIGTNLPKHFDLQIHNYFNEFLTEQYSSNNLCYSIFEFADKIMAKIVNLVHYSGNEDKKYHQKEILNRNQLLEWANSKAKEESLKTIFEVPAIGNEFKMC
jgi:hypothetical protein